MTGKITSDPWLVTVIETDLFFRWTGKVDGRQGIFPANFVEVV